MPSLELRKVLGSGGSFLICLPKGWLTFNGIRQGDKVRVLVNDVLTISPLPKPEAEEQAEGKR